MTTTIKACEAKAGMTILVRDTLRSDTWKFGDLTVKVTRDASYGRWQSWNDASIYIHGERDDGAPYPLWIWDLKEVEVIS